MADVALQFAVDTLVPILTENWKLIFGAKEQCDDLKQEVYDLQAFLKDAAIYRKSNSEQWKNFIKKVQVAVYKAECFIDMLLVTVKLHQDKNPFLKRLDAKYPISIRDLASNIKAALEQIKKIRLDHPKAFEINPTLPRPEVVAPQPQDTLLEEHEVVGFDKEAETVIQRLDEGTSELDVIPVVGLPGLGKTTLARKIYKDPKISFNFFKSIWVYVGYQYKLKEVFLNILEKFTKTTGTEYQNMPIDELANKICEHMSKGGKCLVVLDDVWAPEVVHSVKKVFPENNKGHRIMITTRQQPIGRYANEHPHLLKFLTNDESFQLLENRVFCGNTGRCPEELIVHGKNIAKKCSGVPLAVVVIAGALKGIREKSKWKLVEDNVPQYLINENGPNSCLGFVEMSYGHLPDDMKACFLYCGAFPPGFEIPAWKLVRLWISEGLIKSGLTASLEDLAEQYLNELVNRNLVMVMQKRADGQVKTCRLHDMLHQFCKVEAKNGGLFQEVEKADQSGLHTSHRLCIQLSLLEDFISRSPSAQYVRSFLCFSPKQKESKQLGNIQLLHKAFPLVKVLDVESLKFSFSKDFKEKFHLRYIAIAGNLVALPAFFSKFWNLETIILNTEQSTIEIKADIWNMLQLRHLHTNAPAKLPSPGTSTSNKPSCIQTLSKVATESCREDVLAKACNLRRVSIQGKMADFFETTKGEFRNFEKLNCLENLKLLNDICITKLQLPSAFLQFLRKLTKLTLSNTRFDWSDANKLGNLECLEVLKLKEHAFDGPNWDSEGFGLLKVLWIERADLQNWTASKHSFIRLKNLVLKSCEKLEAVPFEFAGVKSLTEMTLENTKKAHKSAKAIQGKKKEMLENSKFTLTIFPPEKTAEC